MSLSAILEAANTVRCHSPEETKVGVALIAENDQLFTGTNMNHQWHYSVHAEVAAISAMVSAGQRRFVQLALVCDRQQFTPCGFCLDWMFQYARDDGVEILVSDGVIATSFTLHQLMPFYPGAWARNA